MDYLGLLTKTGGPHEWAKGITVAVDPGGTTGVAIFKDGVFYRGYQADTDLVYEKAPVFIRDILLLCPDRIVCEIYRVYAWKTDTHAWNDMHTSRLIGAIEVRASESNVPMFMQSAQQAKNFATDERLHKWGLWQEGLKHERDAIRHGIFWSIFGPKQSLKHVVPSGV